MKSPRIRHAVASAAFLALATAAQAQEAGAWEMHGPPAAASTVSRDQVVSAVMWARAQGWRPAAEASRFDDAADPADRRRKARATHTRTAAVAPRREARASRQLARVDHVGAVERAPSEPHALQERDAERAERWDATVTAAAMPQPLPAAGALSSGTEAASAAVPSPVLASAGPIEGSTDRPLDGSGKLPDDLPQAPLAPGREMAVASPVRPGLPDGSGSPLPADAVVAPETALPPASPAAPTAPLPSADATDAGEASTRPVAAPPTVELSDLAPQSR